MARVSISAALKRYYQSTILSPITALTILSPVRDRSKIRMTTDSRHLELVTIAKQSMVPEVIRDDLRRLDEMESRFIRPFGQLLS